MDDGVAVAVAGLLFAILSALVAVIWRMGSKMGSVLTTIDVIATRTTSLESRISKIDKATQRIRLTCAAQHGIDHQDDDS